MKHSGNILRKALVEANTGVLFAWDTATLKVIELPDASGISCGQIYDVPVLSNRHIYALELILREKHILPHDLQCGATQFVRIMDRVFVPLPRDKTTTIAVFDACSEAYESIIDKQRNIRNVTRLLHTIVTSGGSCDFHLKILDFGCGTGLSLHARRENPRFSKVALYGFDASPHMRHIAAGRGLCLSAGDEVDFYDGVFASYVLQGGVGDDDIERIATALKKGGVFAGNWIHGENGSMKNFLQRLAAVRPGKGEIVCETSGWYDDPIVKFVVDE